MTKKLNAQISQDVIAAKKLVNVVDDAKIRSLFLVPMLSVEKLFYLLELVALRQFYQGF